MMCELKGKVKSGLGEGNLWVQKISNIFEKRYGVKLFLGTFNVELEKEYVLSTDEKILPEEYGGDYVVLVQKCKIFEDTAYILRPDMDFGGHPLNIVEIVTDVNLRKKYNLKEGDFIKIEI